MELFARADAGGDREIRGDHFAQLFDQSRLDQPPERFDVGAAGLLRLRRMRAFLRQFFRRGIGRIGTGGRIPLRRGVGI